jgi:hypothetical protein
MNPADQISFLNAWASAAAAFAHDYPTITVMVIATICSWTLTAAIRGWIPHRPRRALIVRTLDCAIAFGLALFMLWGLLPPRVLVGVSLLIGSGSPTIYWLLSSALCWKWPGLKKWLSLRELGPDPEPSNDLNTPSGDGQ